MHFISFILYHFLAFFSHAQKLRQHRTINNKFCVNSAFFWVFYNSTLSLMTLNSREISQQKQNRTKSMLDQLFIGVDSNISFYFLCFNSIFLRQMTPSSNKLSRSAKKKTEMFYALVVDPFASRSHRVNLRESVDLILTKRYRSLLF